MNETKRGLLVLVSILVICAAVTVTAQPTPFMIYGYVFYENSSSCNGPVVNITNLNTSINWSAETNASYNYYQRMLANGTDVNVSETLQVEVKSQDGTQSKVFNLSVNETEVNNGGILNLSVTLESTAELPVHNINTSENFSTIQDAIYDNGTKNGHIIEVEPGNYTENVKVNKSLTIRSTSGNPEDTIVNASNPDDHVFEVTADYVNISGFAIKNATGTDKAGIKLNNADNCNILTNNVTNNYYGIYLNLSNDNLISNNTISLNNDSGIYLHSSSGNVLTNNTINSNNDKGIYLHSLGDNMLTNNTINYNDKGLYLKEAYENVITNNTINFNHEGITVYHSNTNMFNNNTCSNNTKFDFYSDEDSRNIIIKNLTIASYPTTISFTYGNGIGLKGVDTAPPDPADKKNISKYVNVTNVSASSWIFLNVSYEDADLGSVNENSLRMYEYYPFNGGWEEVKGSGVNTTGNYVYANITSFSIFAPLGNITALRVHNLNTGKNFSTIQAAIYDNDTQNGHIIEVDPGTYHENVKVNKSVTIRSTSGNPADTIVNASDPEGHVFNVTADYVNISGFTATGSEQVGIYLNSVYHCNISDNNASNNAAGIGLYSSSNNTLTNNTANSNDEPGIWLESSSNNTISDNNVSNNAFGIWIENSIYNTIKDNNVSHNLRGASGIHLENANYTTIAANSVTDNDDDGIYLYSSFHNYITNNNVSNNDYGIRLFSSSGNTIYNNYFNNTNNAYDDGNNRWNITNTSGTNIVGGPYLGGNYWSDYAGNDTNGDGLGDTLLPYNSSGGIQNGGDWLPLVKVKEENLTNWEYRTNITIKENSGTTLTDYQVEIALTASNFNFSKAKADGSDIRFTDALGDELPYWIEKWDAVNEEAILWVKVPLIPASNETKIKMYYGNTNASSQSNGDTTFELFNVSGIKGFWHMDESSWNGTSGEVKDETGVNNGTANNGANTTANGKFNGAGSFDGSNCVKVPDSSSLDIGSLISGEAWIKTATVGRTIISKRPGSMADDIGFRMHVYPNGTIICDMRDLDKHFSVSSVNTSEWVHVACTYDNDRIRIYINGILETDEDAQNGLNSDNNADLCIGARGTSCTESFFNGTIDELRIYNRVLNSTEISKIYNNYMEKMGSYYNVRKYTSPEPTIAITSYPVHNLNTSENFSTIQDAIYAPNTTDGHIIEVDPGTYHENVKVNKSLTIRSASGNSADSIVNASNPNDHVFEVTADYVNISGFTVENATGSGKAGIYLGNGLDHCNISDNYATNNDYGIHLHYSSNNTLTNNTANSNTYGIYLLLSSNNTLTCNTANNNYYGISLRSFSNNNTLTRNTMMNNSNRALYLGDSSNNNTLTNNNARHNPGAGIILDSYSGYNVFSNNTLNNNSGGGIYLSYASNNSFTNNTASNSSKGHGIDISNCNDTIMSNNTVSNNSFYGIYLFSCINTSWTNNTVSNNGWGIKIQQADNNTFTNNTVSNNTDYGIYLSDSSNITFKNNTVCNNKDGIRLISSNRILIYNNYFNNTNNAYDNGNNIWNITKTSGTNIINGSWLGGNYWSDYTGKDTDGDGLGENPYNISGGVNKDYHPLVLTPTLISITLSDYTVQYGTLGTGENATSTIINATNNGTVNETFYIRGADAYYNISTWILAESIGDNTFTHEFSNDTNWYYLSNTTDKTLAANVPIGANASFTLRITLPSFISAHGQYTTNVTIMATEA